MANWYYNGVVLPEFPTDFGVYSEGYIYRVIVWEEKRQRWYAMASSGRFELRDKGDGYFCLYVTDYHGQYYLDQSASAWEYVGKHYKAGVAVTFGDEYGYRMVWANHDIISRVDGSVFWGKSEPVSPDSIITNLTPNVTELYLNRGESFQLTAEVEGTEVFSSWVTWTLSGNDANGDTTITSDGFLSVGDTEYSSKFEIIVASVQDPSVSRTITVTVADYLSKLNLNIVTNMYTYNGVTLPAFPTEFKEYSEEYIYRCIVWEEKRQRWYATASARKFVIADKGDGTLGLYATDYYGQYYLPVDGMAWEYVGVHYKSGSILTFGDENGYQMVWANHDVISRVDGSVFWAGSEPVQLCTPVMDGDSTIYQITGSTVWLDGTCAHLNTTDQVYTVKAWLYRLEDGLNTTLPPTWTSDVFGGPQWSQRLTFSALEPHTQYGIYAVIFVEDAATDHFWNGTVTTEEMLGPDFTFTSLYVDNPEYTQTTADFDIGWWNLPTVWDAIPIQFFISVDLSDGTNQTVYLFSSTDPVDDAHWFSFDGLTPGTNYTLTAKLLYNKTGEFSDFIDSGVFVTYAFTTLAAGFDRDSFLLGFASGLGATAATKADAEHNSWMQGYIVGVALMAALRDSGTGDDTFDGIQSSDSYTLLDSNGVYLIPTEG